MSPQKVYIALATILRKEVVRFMRIWTQTLLPSVITATLYFVVFGAFIGSQIQKIQGVTYMQFIVPGLVMMAVITNAYSNVVSSFFGAKFMRNIEEILVSPTPNWVIIAGFCVGGILRGIVVGILVLLVALFFTHIAIYSLTMVLLFILLTTILFSLAGLLNAIYAKKFDDVALVPTFILTPLIYLGGVFYSVNVLPPFWQIVSKFNPILYMVDGFRYGFFGFSDVNIYVGLVILSIFSLLLLYINLYLLNRGTGLKN